jgi:hypothetical protein
MNDKTVNILNKILAAFESGDIPEALSISVLPRLDVPCSKWSLCNRLIIFLSGTSDARGFNQWKEVGRYPRKGSKAIYILSPRHKKMREDEEERIALTGFAPVAVFRFEDTDGKPLEIPELKPRELPPLVEVAEQWNISVCWQSFQDGYYGLYSPGRKEIVLATHDESVFFHELAHAAHEKVKGKLERGQDWKQEIVAELTAAVLMHLYGRKINDGHAYQYIRRYAEKAGNDVHKACLSVIADVGKCLEMIIKEKDLYISKNSLTA